jgi:hypothetical protein
MIQVSYVIHELSHIHTNNKRLGGKKMRIQSIIRFLVLCLCLLLWTPQAFFASRQENQPAAKAEVDLLQLLEITPSPESIDYIQNKTQFQLHTLLTEQRHPKTWDLSERIQKDSRAGLKMLFSVDEDIVDKLSSLSREKGPLEQAVQAIEEALLSKALSGVHSGKKSRAQARYGKRSNLTWENLSKADSLEK